IHIEDAVNEQERIAVRQQPEQARDVGRAELLLCCGLSHVRSTPSLARVRTSALLPLSYVPLSSSAAPGEPTPCRPSRVNTASSRAQSLSGRAGVPPTRAPGGTSSLGWEAPAT